MTRPLRRDLERLAGALSRGRPVALLFDLDGTLAPFRPAPSRARVPAPARRALQALAALPGVAIGVLSGRALSDLRRRVGLPGIAYAGCSGLEVEIRGRAVRHPRAREGRRRLRRAAAVLRAVARAFPGAWVERKPLGLTLHFRRVSARRVPAIRARAAAGIRPLAGLAALRGGPRTIEVFPALGWDKGTAVRAILLKLRGRPLPLYAGDAENDAEAFRAVRSMRGITIGVGPRAPREARHRLAGPRSLAELLDRLARLARAAVTARGGSACAPRRA